MIFWTLDLVGIWDGDMNYDDLPLLDEADCDDGFNYKNEQYIMDYIERKFEENYYGKVIAYQEDGHLSINFMTADMPTDKVVNLLYEYETEALQSRNISIDKAMESGRVRGYMVGINESSNGANR